MTDSKDKTKAKPAKRSAKTKATKTREQRLWDTADKMRGNLESGEYKHVVLEQAELFAADAA